MKSNQLVFALPRLALRAGACAVTAARNSPPSSREGRRVTDEEDILVLNWISGPCCRDCLVVMSTTPLAAFAP